MIKVFIAHPAFLVLTKIIQLIYFGELGEWIIFVKFLQASTKGTTDHLQQRPHLSSRTVKKTHLHLITKPLFCYPDLCGVKSIIGVCHTAIPPRKCKQPILKEVLKLEVVCSQLTNDRHSFSIAVEIQDSKDIVGFFNPHFTYRDGILCPWEKNVAKVSGCRNQGPFVWGGCLVIDLPCIVDSEKERKPGYTWALQGHSDPTAQNFTPVLCSWQGDTQCHVLCLSEVGSSTLLQHPTAVPSEEKDQGLPLPIRCTFQMD